MDAFLDALIKEYKNGNLKIDLEYNGIVYDTKFNRTRNCIVAKSSKTPNEEFVSLDKILIDYVSKGLIKIKIY